jgi:hypothetical protein
MPTLYAKRATIATLETVFEVPATVAGTSLDAA